MDAGRAAGRRGAFRWLWSCRSRYRMPRRAAGAGGRWRRAAAAGRRCRRAAARRSGRWKSEPPERDESGCGGRARAQARAALGRVVGRGAPRCPRRPHAGEPLHEGPQLALAPMPQRCRVGQHRRRRPSRRTSAIASRGSSPSWGTSAGPAVAEVAVEGVLAVARVPGGHERVGDVRAADGAGGPGRRRPRRTTGAPSRRQALDDAPRARLAGRAQLRQAAGERLGRRPRGSSRAGASSPRAPAPTARRPAITRTPSAPPGGDRLGDAGQACRGRSRPGPPPRAPPPARPAPRAPATRRRRRCGSGGRPCRGRLRRDGAADEAARLEARR